MTDNNTQVPADETTEFTLSDRNDFESRVDALEIGIATQRLQLRHIEQELVDGKEKFKEVIRMLHEHEISIELLKAMKSDITEIKTTVQGWQQLEQQSRGAWKVIVGISAVVGMIIQALVSYFFTR